MLRVVSAASGEEVAAVAVSELPAEDGAPTVVSLKRYLAKEHFQNRYSRFQLRLLHEGDPRFLEDRDSITSPLDLQLVLMSHLPPDEDRDNGFLFVCEEGDSEAVERELQALQNPNILGLPIDQYGPPLLLAAAHGHAQVVRLLLEAGASIEWQHPEDGDRTALHYAAFEGRFEAVRVLLEFGADKDAQDANGLSPLHFAARHDYSDIVHLLLEFGALKGAADGDGLTPLHWAALQGYVHVARVLLDSGAQPENMDIAGRRPLHLAASGGHLETVRLLLDYGAEKEAADIFDRTPSQHASDKAHWAVSELLDSGKCQCQEEST